MNAPMPRPSRLTLTFDRLTLKLVCESHLRWRIFIPNLGTIGLWVLELVAMYVTDGQTDRRTDESNAYCPLPYGRGIINERLKTRPKVSVFRRTAKRTPNAFIIISLLKTHVRRTCLHSKNITMKHTRVILCYATDSYRPIGIACASLVESIKRKVLRCMALKI